MAGRGSNGTGRNGTERNGAEGEGGEGQGRAGQGRSQPRPGGQLGGQAGRLAYATLGQDVGGRTGRGTGRGGHPVGRLKRGRGGEGRSFLPLLCCCLTRRFAGSSLSSLSLPLWLSLRERSVWTRVAPFLQPFRCCCCSGGCGEPFAAPVGLGWLPANLPAATLVHSFVVVARRSAPE